MKPAFDCEGIRLRDLCAGDAADIHAILSDPAVTRFYDMPTLRTESEAAGLIEKWLHAEETDAALRWAVTSKSSGKVLGTAGLHSLDWRHARGEIGFDLHPSWWGKGVMKRVLPRVIEYAFDELKLRRIGATVVPENRPSIQLLSSLGFQREGMLRNFLRIGAQSHDAVCMGLTQKVRESERELEREVVEI